MTTSRYDMTVHEEFARLHLGQRRIFNRISEERAKQDTKWGERNHNDYMWLTILAEEMGEAAQAALRPLDDNEAISGTNELLDDEIIQCAAVAVAWLECRNRNRSE